MHKKHSFFFSSLRTLGFFSFLNLKKRFRFLNFLTLFEKSFWSFLILTLAFSANFAFADQTEILNLLKKQGISVKREFKVSDSINGFLVEQDSSQMILYSTSDGKYIINGILTNANGKNITKMHQEQFLTLPPWSEIEDTAYITEIPLNEELIDAYKIFVFFDPYCPHCRVLWEELQKYRQIGLTIGWVPVAYLRPESREIASYILANNQSAEILEKLMLNKLGNLNIDPKVVESQKNRLRYNLKIMQDFGSQATPAIVWREDKKTKSLSRLPFIYELEKITGLKIKKNPVQTDEK